MVLNNFLIPSPGQTFEFYLGERPGPFIIRIAESLIFQQLHVVTFDCVQSCLSFYLEDIKRYLVRQGKIHLLDSLTTILKQISLQGCLTVDPWVYVVYDLCPFCDLSGDQHIEYV